MVEANKGKYPLHIHAVPTDKLSELDQLHETLLASLKAVEKLKQEECDGNDQIDQRLQRLSQFQGHLKQSLTSMAAQLKDDLKKFVKNENKIAQNLPPIAHPNKVDQMLDGLQFDESVTCWLREVHEQLNQAKKTTTKRLKRRTKKIKRDLLQKIGGRPKKEKKDL